MHLDAGQPTRSPFSRLPQVHHGLHAQIEQNPQAFRPEIVQMRGAHQPGLSLLSPPGDAGVERAGEVECV